MRHDLLVDLRPCADHSETMVLIKKRTISKSGRSRIGMNRVDGGDEVGKDRGKTA